MSQSVTPLDGPNVNHFGAPSGIAGAGPNAPPGVPGRLHGAPTPRDAPAEHPATPRSTGHQSDKVDVAETSAGSGDVATQRGPGHPKEAEKLSGGPPPAGAPAPGAVAAARSAEYDVDDHTLTIAELAARYATSQINVEAPQQSQGLSADEAARLLQVHGPNVLQPPKDLPEILKFLKHFTDVLILALLVAAGLGFLAFGLNTSDRNSVIIAGVLCVMVTLISFISYWQERAASNIMKSIKNMVPTTTRVIRGGNEGLQEVSSLVPGDIVHLTIGVRIPADIRLLVTYDLKVEMSQMTGEPDALEMTPECKSDEALRSRNVVFNGSLVMSGSGYGVVVRTGNETMLGRIAKLASSTGKAQTSTLQVEIHRVAVLVAVVALSFGLMCFIIALARGEGIRSFSVGFIFVIIAAVPEGLPPAVTTVLTLTARRLADRRVLVKRTDIPEVLSAVTTLMSDKTGTLTQGKMHVSGFWINGGYADGDPSHVRRGIAGRSVSFEAGEGPELNPSMDAIYRRVSSGLQMTQLADGSYTVHRNNIMPHPSFRAVEGIEYGPVHEVHLGEQADTHPPAEAPTKARMPRASAALSPTLPSVRALAIRGQQPALSRMRSIMSAELPLAYPPVSQQHAEAHRTWTQNRRRTVLRRAAAEAFRDMQHRIRASRESGIPSAGEPEAPASPVLPATPTVAPLPSIPETPAVTPFESPLPQAPLQPLPPIEPAEMPPNAGAVGESNVDKVDRTRSAPPDVGPLLSPLLPVSRPTQLHRVHATDLGATRLTPRTGAEAVSGALPREETAIDMTVATGTGLLGHATAPKPESDGSQFSAQGPKSATKSPIGAPKSGAAVPESTTIVTFESFAQMQQLDWDASSTFTRMVIAMGVNNKATRMQPNGNARSLPSDAVNDGPAAGDEEGGPQDGDHSSSVGPSAGAHKVATRRHSVQSFWTYLFSHKDKETGQGQLVGARGKHDASKASSTSSMETTTWLGDASDTALARFANELMPIEHLRAAFRIVGELPFNSTHKVAITVVELAAGTSSSGSGRESKMTGNNGHSNGGGSGMHVMLLKGAPERVIDRCTQYVMRGREQAMTDDFLHQWRSAYERFGMTGQRVLGLAYKRIPPLTVSSDALLDSATEMVFLGLVALRDPPKPGVRDAVEQCKTAGVRVYVVTGDHALTAEAIARDVGVLTLPMARDIALADGVPPESVEVRDERVGSAVISGDQLPTLSEEDWDALLSKRELVFARTSPEQKLQIVKHLQRMEHVVAVTGDGTNDAPALKAAQIGIAMGGPGASDAAREAAALVLLDSDFTSIVHAIVEGRTLFVNLRKLAVYWLSHAPAQLWSVFISITLLTPLPLTGLLILTVDLIQEQVVAMSFAFEPTEASVMTRPPRKLGRDTLIDYKSILYSYLIAGTLETLTCVWAYFIIFQYHGVPGSRVLETYYTYWRDNSPDLVVGATVLTAAQQVAIAAEARSAYYLTLIGCQFANLWNCKSQVTSIVQHTPKSLRENRVTLLGVAVMIIATSIIIYVPAINTFFGTWYLVGWAWVFWIAFAIIITAYNEWSKYQVRHNPGGFWARYVQW